MAISAYLEASWTRGRPDLRDRALRALDFLWERLRTDDDGMYRYLVARRPADLRPARRPGVDGARLSRRVRSRRPPAGPRARASSSPAFMQNQLASPNGGFYDTPAGHEDARPPRAAPDAGEGERDRRACVFIRLARLTHDDAYETSPRRHARAVRARRRVAGLLRRRLREGRRPAAEPGRRDEDRRAGWRRMPATTLHSAALALPVPRPHRAHDRRRDAAALEREGLPRAPRARGLRLLRHALLGARYDAGRPVRDGARTRQAYEATRPAQPLAGPRGQMASD